VLIVWTQGKTVLGDPVRKVPGGDLEALEPVYDLQAILARSPIIDGMGRPKVSVSGQMEFTETVTWNVAPVLFLPSIRRLPIPPGAMVYPLDALTPQERQRIVNGLHIAQQKAAEFAASDAGILQSRLVAVKG